MNIRSPLYGLVFFVVLAAYAIQACAADGSYDTSFGAAGTGQAWYDVTGLDVDEGLNLIQLPGGNFFMGGTCSSTACAAWLTQSGELASGYGAGAGTVSFSDYPGWPNDGAAILDAAALPDGRVALVVQKYGLTGAYLVVVLANGSGLDPSVGNGAGYVSVASFNPSLLRVTAQQQFIVAGPSQFSTTIVVARFDSTFHLDTSFGSNGSTTMGFADGSVYPHGMTLQRDGKIVVIGDGGSSAAALVIVRLTAGGQPDPDFGIDSDGRFESTFGNTHGAIGNAIVEDKKGRLVFAGYAVLDLAGGGEWFVDRLLSGGATDVGFNGGHPQQFSFSSTTHAPQACCVALQSDNRIVVAGSMDRDVPSNKYFAIARFMDDGSFDASFGAGGESYGDMSPGAPDVLTDVPLAMVIVPGGIVVAGYTDATTNQMTVSATRFSAAKERIDLLFADGFE